MTALARALWAPLCLAVLAACSKEADVVIYCALDQVHAEPLIERFEKETGLTVEANFDVEANKTVGLVMRLRGEKAAPRCDVFWNNEIANTVALGAEGLLQPYASPSAQTIPAQFKCKGDLWTGFAARARVLIVNTDLIDPSELHGMADVIDQRFAGRAGMARPLTGTTLTHMTALYSVLGPDAARAYVEAAKALNNQGKLSLTSGNATLMKQVAVGELAFGWTDTDDFNVAREKGEPVAVVYPDQDRVGPDGAVIPGELVDWAAGVKGPAVLRNIGGLETTPNDQLVVLPTLQTTRYPDIFALGDCAACPRPDGKGNLPPRAQAAHQQATHLYRQIDRKLRGL